MIFVSYVIHCIMTSAEEDICNSVKEMPCTVDTSQTFSSAISVINRLLNNVTMMAEMGVTQGLSNICFHSPLLIWSDPVGNAQPVSARHQP